MRKSISKKGFYFLPIIISGIVVAIIVSFFLLQRKCTEVRTFSVGSIDPRFKISSNEVLKIAQDAAGKWNEQTGEVLLKYDSSSALKINLIYDERQASVDKINQESQSLQKNRQTIENTKEKFDQLLVAFQKDLSDYNNNVAYWNKRGGAPADAYSRLESTRISLDARRNQLIAMSKTLNLQADGYNADLNDLQSEADKRKNLIITQGLYIPAKSEINIYTFGNSNELRLVLMHELGHSLGLDHSLGQESIMYYLLGDQNLSAPVLTAEDKNMILNRCSVTNSSLYSSIFKLLSGEIQ